jgi:PqqD family protein of HPr-rel-A system
VLYHRLSGQTHFVNAATALLLRQILLEPIDAKSAGRALASAHEAAESADLIDQVAAILHHLEELGLVEQVRS